MFPHREPGTRAEARCQSPLHQRADYCEVKEIGSMFKLKIIVLLRDPQHAFAALNCNLFKLDIQVSDLACMGLDESPAGWYLDPHKHIEGSIRCSHIFDGYKEQCARFRIHGRIP